MLMNKQLGAFSATPKTQALRGFRPNAWPMALRRDRSAPLQSLAHFDAPLRRAPAGGENPQGFHPFVRHIPYSSRESGEFSSLR
ncbi:MAG: hypothetical protein LBK61_02270 [Spirochaetaceae bacterium]|nr:hypothetical protein [Spirochaetaceae bacterium]